MLHFSAAEKKKPSALVLLRRPVELASPVLCAVTEARIAASVAESSGPSSLALAKPPRKYSKMIEPLAEIPTWTMPHAARFQSIQAL